LNRGKNCRCDNTTGVLVSLNPFTYTPREKIFFSLPLDSKAIFATDASNENCVDSENDSEKCMFRKGANVKTTNFPKNWVIFMTNIRTMFQNYQ
jgi:hypothetical protein